MKNLKMIICPSIGVNIVLAGLLMMSLREDVKLDRLLTVLRQDDNLNGINEGYFFRMDESFLLAVRDLNDDGVLDEFVYYVDGKVRARVTDINCDSRLDRWEVRNGESGIYARDLDFDGIVDEQKKLSYEVVH